MFFPPAPFHFGDLLRCAELVETAYDMCAQWSDQGHCRDSNFVWQPKGPSDLDYSAPLWGAATFLRFFKNHSPFAFLAADGEGTAFLVFRGTQTPSDGLEDLHASQTRYSLVDAFGDAHEGFVEIYESISPHIRAALERLPDSTQRLLVTGHSLGSALSTLAIPDVLHNSRFGPKQVVHYNLASPRVASIPFADAYQATGVPTYRIVNSADVVPQLPPPILGPDTFRHVGVQLTFSDNHGSVEANHSSKGSYLAALDSLREAGS